LAGDSAPAELPERAANTAQERVGVLPRRRLGYADPALLVELAHPDGTFRLDRHRVDGQVCTHLLAPFFVAVAASLGAAPASFARHVCIMDHP
jgi:hypothetical protein